MSEANLKRCDAICLKIVVGLIVALGFVCAAGRFAISTEIIGYGLMGTLVLLAVIRTVLFCYMDKRESEMALTTKIREYREKQGLTQSELADLVGVRRETIVNLERGRYNPSLKLAMDIAKVFHVTVEEIFSYTE